MEQDRVKFMQNILGFSDPWVVENIEEKFDNEEIIISLSYPKGTKFKCPECGKECVIYDSKYRTWRHLDLFQYKAYIKAKIPRIDCCG